MAATVTIQYFDGCPNHRTAEARVAEAIRRIGGPAPAVQLVEVTDVAEAECLGFRGSPTVLVDGTDPFTDPSAPVGFACRVYATAAGREGSPSVDQLVEALR